MSRFYGSVCTCDRWLLHHAAAKNTSTHFIDIRELREVGASNDRRLEVVSVEVKLTRAWWHRPRYSVESSPRTEHRPARPTTETRRRAPGCDVTPHHRCHDNHDAHHDAGHRFHLTSVITTSAAWPTNIHSYSQAENRLYYSPAVIDLDNLSGHVIADDNRR